MQSDKEPLLQDAPLPSNFSLLDQTNDDSVSGGPRRYLSESAPPEIPMQVTSGISFTPVACVPFNPVTVISTQGVAGPGVTVAPMQTPNNSLLVTSLVVSMGACICSVLCTYVTVICAFPGLILSIIAMSSRSTSTAEATTKNNLAKIGLVLSIVAFVVSIILIVLVIVWIISLANIAQNYSSETCLSPISLIFNFNAYDCTWQSDPSSNKYCCCRGGSKLSDDCYIDGKRTLKPICILVCGLKYA
jgi:hypothetical protein